MKSHQSTAPVPARHLRCSVVHKPATLSGNRNSNSLVYESRRIKVFRQPESKLSGVMIPTSWKQGFGEYFWTILSYHLLGLRLLLMSRWNSSRFVETVSSGGQTTVVKFHDSNPCWKKNWHKKKPSYFPILASSAITRCSSFFQSLSSLGYKGGLHPSHPFPLTTSGRAVESLQCQR